MKIASAWSGHDCSFAVLDDGIPTVHAEYERYIREKEPKGDSVQFMYDEYEGVDGIDHFVQIVPENKLTDHDKSYTRITGHVAASGGKVFTVGHHQAHAANAFFSSNFDEAAIITLDGGGVDIVDGKPIETACTVWKGAGNKIEPIMIIPMQRFNIGGLWTRVTRYVFELQSGWPRGHQAGTVMAMAAMGDPNRFVHDFVKMLTEDLLMASFKPPSQPPGACVPGKDPVHPYLEPWKQIAKQSEQDAFDVAAGLQAASEALIFQLVGETVAVTGLSKVCFAGGVTLNSVAVGKLRHMPWIDDIFVTPVPHDGGLTVGACQYVWHQVFDKPRVAWNDNASPYLGVQYDKAAVFDAIAERGSEIITSRFDVEGVAKHLSEGKIVSVFSGCSESGRRALGNRSILADPRNPDMKDIINERIKHRQWFRPFAPSILRSEVADWFTIDADSPYMNLVLNFKDEAKDKVPAVVHLNGTARLQTVTENDNKWYFDFLTLWHKESGVPIILNTSFNDRTPIVETPAHAIDCFLGTDIDYLYFVDEGILVEKVRDNL
jgi:carbamoyltransferase